MATKTYLCTLLLLTLSWSASAQIDTTFQTIHQETGTYTAPVIETPADRLFRTNVPSKWMFKLGFAPSINPRYLRFDFEKQNGLPINIGVEHKLSPVFSIGAYYNMGFGYQPNSVFVDEGKIVYTSSVTLEGRWYHDMKKRIREGRSANNFGGKYFAAQGQLQDNSVLVNGFDGKSIGLRYGSQFRMARMGYVDVSLGLNIYEDFESISSYTFNIFSTDQRLIVGLASFLPKGKSSIQEGDFCDVTRCQEEQSKAQKINLYNIVGYVTVRGLYTSFYLRPNIAFEQKIGLSPFSLEFDLKGFYDNIKFGDFNQSANVHESAASWNAAGELRWYFNMRKRILKGLTGNNLSGIFCGLRFNRSDFIKDAYRYSSKVFIRNSDRTLRGDHWWGGLVLGVQQRILTYGFYQLKVGYGHTFGGHNYLSKGPNIPLTKIGATPAYRAFMDIKAGFFF